jgi:DNA-3-methyladenine glycosylase I
MTDKIRCKWCLNDPLNIAYHDTEWGTPNRDDAHLFEMLVLEMMEAGLSWILILRKREHFRQALDNFHAPTIAQYDDAKIAALLENPNIIRSKAKLAAVVNNAKLFLQIQSENGSFADYIWQFVNHKPIQNAWATYDDVPGSTPEAEAMSKALKKRGFKFVGPSVCYAFMQSVGMVNDHVTTCFRHAELAE